MSDIDLEEIDPDLIWGLPEGVDMDDLADLPPPKTTGSSNWRGIQP